MCFPDFESIREAMRYGNTKGDLENAVNRCADCDRMSERTEG